MLYTVNSAVAVAASSNIPSNTVYLTNNNTSWSGDTATIKTPGYYKVHFDATGSPDAAGIVSATAVLNGTLSTTALASETSTGATDFVNISFDTVLKIVPTNSGFATLSFRNTGVDSTFVAVNLIIERIA